MKFTLTILIVAIIYAGLVVGAVFLDRVYPLPWWVYGMFFTGYNVGAALFLDWISRRFLTKLYR